MGAEAGVRAENSALPDEYRYSIERTENGSWIVVDRANQRPPVGRAGDEDGARRILSLLNRVRGASERRQEVEVSSGPADAGESDG